MLPLGSAGLSVLALTVAVSAVAAPGQTAAPPGGTGGFKTHWETVLQEDASELELQASTASLKDGTVWLALGKRPAGMMSGPQSLAVRTLDSGGKSLSEITIEALTKAAALPIVPDKVVDMAAMPDGNVALVLSAANQIWLVTLEGKTARFLRKKDLAAQKPDLLITRLLATPGGNLLLLGRQGVRAAALEFDASLASAWESLSNPDDVAVYLDAAVFAGETFSAVGARAPKRGMSADSSLWLGAFSAAGKASNSVNVPGRFGSLAPAPDGGCAMVAGVASAQGMDFWFKSYDRNLKETGSAKLVSGPPVAQPFRLAPVANAPGDFLIVGADKRRTWIARFHGASAVWQQTFTEAAGAMPRLFWNAGLAQAAGGMLVAVTELTVNARMQQRQVVRAIGLDLR